MRKIPQKRKGSRGNAGPSAVRIADCAEVLPGFSIHGRIKPDPRGTHQVVVPRHLTEGQPYTWVQAHDLRIKPSRDPSRYLVRCGDVLFLSRGTRNIAVALDSVPEPTIAPLLFFILRPTAGVDPHYLTWCLDQPQVQAQVAQIRSGSGTPLIRRDALEKIIIPLPCLDTQRKVGHLAELMACERRLRERLDQERERGYRALGQRLMESLRNGADVEGGSQA
jgi:hypothetical protein